jgi:hypothetical protein
MAFVRDDVNPEVVIARHDQQLEFRDVSTSFDMTER